MSIIIILLMMLQSVASLKRGLFVEVPYRMGLGLAALGRPGYINLDREKDLGGTRTEEMMRERAFRVLDAAFESGLRWFDAARSYGLSEQFLGDYLRSRKIAPEDVWVSSKWGYRYAADWKVDVDGPHEVKDHSLAHLKSQIAETEAALGDYVDLYQIHSATFESGVLDNQEVLKELETLKKKWKIGLSVSSPLQSEVLRKALTIKCADNTTLLFDACQVTFNIFEQATFDALIEANDKGLKIIVKEAMANGRVLQAEPLLTLAKSLHCSPDALALAAVLAQPFNAFVLSGAVTSDQLQSNLKAKELADSLDPDIFQKLLTQCQQDSKTYWADRAALKWN